MIMDELEELARLRALQNVIWNQLGMKDADEVNNWLNGLRRQNMGEEPEEYGYIAKESNLRDVRPD